MRQPDTTTLGGKAESVIRHSVERLGFATFLMFGTMHLLVSAAEPLLEKTALLTASQAADSRLEQLKAERFSAVALVLTETEATQITAAAARIKSAGLHLDYWIEVARNPTLAEAHPEWMASIQTHEEWRRFYPDFPKPDKGGTVKVYPWVPVLYEETFNVHVERVAKLLDNVPAPRRVFLNDLQGAPSACGCGHPLCRWTTDYGPIKTATRLPHDAAAKFVAAVKRLAPGMEIIPVWTTECESHDKEGLCAGVGCYRGACWRDWTAQLSPLAAEAPMLAALVPYRAFQRDLPIYERTAGWISQSLKFFETMPARYDSKGVPVSRLIAVVQGWDVTQDQLKAQMARAREAGAPGVIVAYTEIDQSWEPRLFNRIVE